MKTSVTDRWGRALLLAAGVIGFVAVLDGADLEGASALLAASGPILLLALLPYVVQIGLDAACWRSLLDILGARLPLRRVFTVRIATEAVLMSVPVGSVIAETLKPYVLFRTDRIAPAHTIATIGAKKCLLVFAQVIYLGVALVLGWSLLEAISPEVIGGAGLPVLVAGAALFLAFVGVALCLAFFGGGLGRQVHRALMRIPIESFRAWLATRHEPFRATDASFVALRRAPAHRLLAGLALLLVAWFVEAAETWLLLRLLGVDLPIVQVLVMEAIVVFVRNAVFFVPAGLGVQDAGYLTFLHAFSVAGAGTVGAAFVILKRAKEAVWIVIGYVALVVLQSRAVPPPPRPDPVLLTTETA